MGAIDDAQQALFDAVEDWDFTPAFPANYPSNYGVIVETGWPWSPLDKIDVNSLGKSNIDATGQMQQYLITLLDLHSPMKGVRLGDNFGSGSQQGTTRHGKRMTAQILVSAWADQRLGGFAAVRRLASELYGCMLYNQNRLPGFKHLEVLSTAMVNADGAQLYRYDMTVGGDGIVSIDY